MKRVIILSISLLFLFLPQTSLSVNGQAIQNTFEFGHVREYDFAGDRIWPANTKKKDRIASKSIAVLGYNGLGQ